MRTSNLTKYLAFEVGTRFILKKFEHVSGLLLLPGKVEVDLRKHMESQDSLVICSLADLNFKYILSEEYLRIFKNENKIKSCL